MFHKKQENGNKFIIVYLCVILLFLNTKRKREINLMRDFSFMLKAPLRLYEEEMTERERDEMNHTLLYITKKKIIISNNPYLKQGLLSI